MSQHVSLSGGKWFHHGYWWSDTSRASGIVVCLVRPLVRRNLMKEYVGLDIKLSSRID